MEVALAGKAMEREGAAAVVREAGITPGNADLQ